MPFLEPDQPEDKSKGLGSITNAESRNRRIAQLSMSKQFAIRTQLNDCDNLSREQAIELLKECIVQAAMKDRLYADLMKGSII